VSSGETTAIAIADAASFRAIVGKEKSFWLRRDVEHGRETFAFAKSIPMIDERDVCPDRGDAGAGVSARDARDATADANAADDDGCP
jgi:hypothetical protein